MRKAPKEVDGEDDCDVVENTEGSEESKSDEVIDGVEESKSEEGVEEIKNEDELKKGSYYIVLIFQN